MIDKYMYDELCGLMTSKLELERYQKVTQDMSKLL